MRRQHPIPGILSDWERGSVVCVPHSPDPVLYGIRGDSPFAVAHAVSCIKSEPFPWGQIWLTNQGTDAHLLEGTIGSLNEETRHTRYVGLCYTIRSQEQGVMSAWSSEMEGKNSHAWHLSQRKVSDNW